MKDANQIEQTLERKIKLAQIDHEQVANEIGDFIVSKVLEFGATGCVIGLSGGIDSTTSGALAKRRFDKYNSENPDKTPLELVGEILPSNTNKPEDAEDGVKVAKMLGVRYEVQNIEPIVQAYKATNPEVFESQYAKGNLMSRIRANVLNTKAETENKKVLGTGNKDEDYGLGYYTLFGDGAVHLSPISNLSKRHVREMASYLGVSDELVNRTPSAGLEPGQTDFGDLGYSYDIVELVMEGKDQSFSTEELYMHSQVTSLVERDNQQYTSLYGKLKFETAQEVVDDVLRRHENALKKVQLISPPVAEVTLNYAA